MILVLDRFVSQYATCSNRSCRLSNTMDGTHRRVALKNLSKHQLSRLAVWHENVLKKGTSCVIRVAWPARASYTDHDCIYSDPVELEYTGT